MKDTRSKRKKAQLHFTLAFEAWTGKKWDWKRVDGSENHPLDSDDPKIRAFYLGFRYAVNHMFKDIKRIENEMELAQSNLSKLKKEITGWKTT